MSHSVFFCCLCLLVIPQEGLKCLHNKEGTRYIFDLIETKYSLERKNMSEVKTNLQDSKKWEGTLSNNKKITVIVKWLDNKEKDPNDTENNFFLYLDDEVATPYIVDCVFDDRYISYAMLDRDIYSPFHAMKHSCSLESMRKKLYLNLLGVYQHHEYLQEVSLNDSLDTIRTHINSIDAPVFPTMENIRKVNKSVYLSMDSDYYKEFHKVLHVSKMKKPTISKENYVLIKLHRFHNVLGLSLLIKKLEEFKNCQSSLYNNLVAFLNELNMLNVEKWATLDNIKAIIEGYKILPHQEFSSIKSNYFLRSPNISFSNYDSRSSSPISSLGSTMSLQNKNLSPAPSLNSPLAVRNSP